MKHFKCTTSPNLHSNMERFKDTEVTDTVNGSSDLHSNMERFKVPSMMIYASIVPNLHSNMERFKVKMQKPLALQPIIFTFQYGEI